MKNKDHLVGQLTTITPDWGLAKQTVVLVCCVLLSIGIGELDRLVTVDERNLQSA